MHPVVLATFVVMIAGYYHAGMLDLASRTVPKSAFLPMLAVAVPGATYIYSDYFAANPAGFWLVLLMNVGFSLAFFLVASFGFAGGGDLWGLLYIVWLLPPYAEQVIGVAFLAGAVMVLATMAAKRVRSYREAAGVTIPMMVPLAIGLAVVFADELLTI